MKKGQKTGLIVAAGLALGAGYFVFGARAPATLINVSEARAVPVEGSQGHANIYLKIATDGPPDRLIGAHSAQGEALLYSPEDPVGPPIPTGAAPVLAADGAHVKISGLDDLGDGRLVALALEFERAGRVNVQARVDAPEMVGAAASVGLFGDGDICIVGDGEPAPKISLTAEQVGDAVNVRVVSDEFTFDQEQMGGLHVPGFGHGHLYVGGLKLGRIFDPDIEIAGLPKGTHRVRVTLNTNDHRAYVVDDEPVTASVEVVVQ